MRFVRLLIVAMLLSSSLTAWAQVLDADTVRFSLASCLEEVGALREAVDELTLVIDQADAELVARAQAERERLRAAHPATLVILVDARPTVTPKNAARPTPKGPGARRTSERVSSRRRRSSRP